MNKADVGNAPVGARVMFARMVQAETPGRALDGAGDAPWPKRTIWYEGVLATVNRIGPRVGAVLGDVEACRHHHPRANGALKCALKRAGDGERPRVLW